MPEKYQFSARFSGEFIEQRRAQLQSYLNRLAAHSIIRYSSVFLFFLSCTDDKQWADIDNTFPLSELEARGSDFFDRVFYPEYNVDIVADSETVVAFDVFTSSNEPLLKLLATSINDFDTQRKNADASLGAFSQRLADIVSGQRPSGSPDGAIWCWRPKCAECKRLTVALQGSATALHALTKHAKPAGQGSHISSFADAAKHHANSAYKFQASRGVMQMIV